MKKQTKTIIVIILAIIIITLIYLFFFRTKQEAYNLSLNTFYAFADPTGDYQSGCGNFFRGPDATLLSSCNAPTGSGIVNIYGYSYNLKADNYVTDANYKTACGAFTNINGIPYAIKYNAPIINYNGVQIGKIDNPDFSPAIRNGISCDNRLSSSIYISLANNQIASAEPSSSFLKIDHRQGLTGLRDYYDTYELGLKKDLISVNMTPLKTQYITGENITVDAQINNKFGQIYAQFCTSGSINTIFGLSTTKTCMDRILLPKGITNIQYTLPIKEVPTQEIQLIPSLEVWLDKSQVSGVIFDYRSQGISTKLNTCCEGSCWQTAIDFYKCIVPEGSSGIGQYIGNIELDKQTLLLNPKPIYLNKEIGKDCPSGYSLSYDNNYCILDGIKELGCYKLGCPVIEGHNYECTSTGICAETIYKLSNETIALLNSLQTSVNEKQDIITQLNISIEEQKVLINSLTINETEKSQLLSQVNKNYNFWKDILVNYTWIIYIVIGIVVLGVIFYLIKIKKFKLKY